MTHATFPILPARAGRPKIDDREQILGYFAANLAKGLSISQIARPGLNICGYAPGPDGKTMQLQVLRKLGAGHLERRYRELRRQLDQAIASRNSEPALLNAQYVGGASPKDPVGFGRTPKLNRGRPRKKRTH